MLLIPLTLIAALVPSILLVWFFRSRDEHPEPSGVLWATFGLGILSIIPTLIVAVPVGHVLEGVLGSRPLIHGAVDAFLVAAFPEELFKMCVVLFYCARHRAFDEPMDGVVYGVVASLGFATFENVMYVASGGIGVAIMRAFTAVPMHAFCGAIMGYYIARWRFPQGATGQADKRGSVLLLAAAYLGPVLLHGLYDAPLLAIGKATAGGNAQISDGMAMVFCGGVAMVLFVMLVEITWALLLVRKLKQEQAEMLAHGDYVPVEAALAAEAKARGPVPTIAWVLMILSFFFGGAAGFFGLVVIAMLADPEMGASPGLAVVTGAIFVLPPTLISVVFFVLGLKKFPKVVPRRSPFVVTEPATGEA